MHYDNIEIKELMNFIDLEDKRLREKFSHLYTTQKERIFARAIKLNEEVGELCNELLAFVGDQRNDKINNNQNISEKINEELSDVIIVALLLSKTIGVDILEGLKKKIEEINLR